MPIKNRRRNKVKLSVRRQTASERLKLRNGRTPEQQLAELDKRLGKGVGAKRERARLAKMLAGNTAPIEKKAPAKKASKKKA